MTEVKQSPQGFLSERLTETAEELKAVREKVKELKDRLGEADNLLKFYGDPRSYKALRTENALVYQDILRNDWSNADNDKNTFIAGKRARDYLSRHGLQ